VTNPRDAFRGRSRSQT